MRATLQRAYYEGRVLGASGETVVESERLWALFGELGGDANRRLRPGLRTALPALRAIAPGAATGGPRPRPTRSLTSSSGPGRCICRRPPRWRRTCWPMPGRWAWWRVRSATSGWRSQHGGLVAAVLAATPRAARGEAARPRGGDRLRRSGGRVGEERVGSGAGAERAAESAALLRTGHLTALDAFLQPLRFDAIAAPLNDFLPYVMPRHAARAGAAAEAARALWSGRDRQERSQGTCPRRSACGGSC